MQVVIEVILRTYLYPVLLANTRSPISGVYLFIHNCAFIVELQ